MPYSITTKDGITVQNIPDDEPADSPRLKERVAQIRAQLNPAPREDQQQLASTTMRVAKGMKDPIDGLAQIAARAPGAGGVNSAADAFGSFLNKHIFNTPTFNRIIGVPENTQGDFAGEVLGLRGATPEKLDAEIQANNADYEQARQATGQEGFDGARLVGNVVSPVSATVAKLVPGAGAGAGMREVAKRGALGGAAGAVTQPVQGENFLTEKAGQAVVGAAAGAALAPVLTKVFQSAGRFVDRWRNSRNTVNVTPERLQEMVRQQLAADGIDAAQLPEHVFAGLADDVRTALAQGRQLEPAAALRQRDFAALGLPSTQGQVTRNPAQWQREVNLAGVEGVGEPLQALQAQQSQRIASRFRDGAGRAQERFDAGRLLTEQLQGADNVAQGNVRAAYGAFREATGRELEVPLQGLAQDYARTLETFGDAVPSAVRRHFEGLGLLGGTQRRGLSIEQAEQLIKVINANTDPANRVASRALDELRRGVQRSISEAADTSAAGAEAAHLAAEARGMAAQRFRAIEETPALRAAIGNAEPDDFVRKFVLGGKVNEIQRMQELLGPEGREQVRAQTVAYLQQKAFGANAAGDGKAAQAAFNQELQRIGRPKLVALLGEEGAEEMLRIGRVLAYIKQVPEGATPNTSGTGQMLTSMLGRTRGLRGLPYVNDYIVQPLTRFGDRRAVQAALSGPPQQARELDPQTIKALSALFAPVPVAAGVSAGSGGR
jgi:hypothetical protein